MLLLPRLWFSLESGAGLWSGLSLNSLTNCSMTHRTDTWLQGFFPKAQTWTKSDFLPEPWNRQQLVAWGGPGISGMGPLVLPAGCRWPSGEIPEPFSLPLYSLLPTSPSDPHCAVRAKGHQTAASRREAGENDRTACTSQSTATLWGQAVTRACCHLHEGTAPWGQSRSVYALGGILTTHQRKPSHGFLRLSLHLVYFSSLISHQSPTMDPTQILAQRSPPLNPSLKSYLFLPYLIWQRLLCIPQYPLLHRSHRKRVYLPASPKQGVDIQMSWLMGYEQRWCVALLRCALKRRRHASPFPYQQLKDRQGSERCWSMQREQHCGLVGYRGGSWPWTTAQTTSESP